MAAETTREDAREIYLLASIVTPRFGDSRTTAVALAPLVFGEARNGEIERALGEVHILRRRADEQRERAQNPTATAETGVRVVEGEGRIPERVAPALSPISRTGVLFWVNRIKRVREPCADLCLAIRGVVGECEIIECLRI